MIAGGLFLAYYDTDFDKQYKIDSARCGELLEQYAKRIARQTGEYELAKEIEDAYVDVCIDESEALKHLLAFGDRDGSGIKEEHKQKLEQLVNLATSMLNEE